MRWLVYYPMNAWLLLPVKPFSQGKSRLSSNLHEHERLVLNRALMRHVFETARTSHLFENIVVISRDVEVLDLARTHNAHALAEQGYGLNRALDQGRSYALARHAPALLVLPADLPNLTIADLQLILQNGRFPGSIVIAPSSDGGTNALFMRPPHLLSFQFGRNSFQAHCNAARQQRLTIHTAVSPGLQTDIDLPEDLPSLPGNFLPSNR